MYNVSFGQMVCVTNDSATLMEKGFFHGYTPTVWLVILLQAGGGLVRGHTGHMCITQANIYDHIYYHENKVDLLSYCLLVYLFVCFVCLFVCVCASGRCECGNVCG